MPFFRHCPMQNCLPHWSLHYSFSPLKGLGFIAASNHLKRHWKPFHLWPKAAIYIFSNHTLRVLFSLTQRRENGEISSAIQCTSIFHQTTPSAIAMSSNPRQIQIRYRKDKQKLHLSPLSSFLQGNRWWLIGGLISVRMIKPLYDQWRLSLLSYCQPKNDIMHRKTMHQTSEMWMYIWSYQCFGKGQC